MSCAFDSQRNSSLMLCARSGRSAGKDFSSLGNEFAKGGNVLVAHGLFACSAERADLFPSVAVAAASLESAFFIFSECHNLTSCKIALLERQSFVFYSVGNADKV